MKLFVIANLVYAVAVILNIVVWFAIFVLVIDAILSFIVPYGFPVRRIFDDMAEPMLRPLRKIIPPYGMIDFSPFVAILILIFIQTFLVNTFFDLSVVLRK